MSLRVWLPLTGNLDNKGISGLTFSNNNTTYTTLDTANGKFGKCYRNSSNTAGGIVSDTTIDLGYNQSMFCWVNITSVYSLSSLGGGLVSQHRYSTCTGMGITLKYISSTTARLSVNTGNGGSSRTFNTYCGNTILNTNTWYHVGYTYDGEYIRLYVNGKLDGIHAYTKSNMAIVADYVSIFSWSWSSGKNIHPDYLLNGYINDVRIYDHTLSQKEITEISKGLLFHYKLDLFKTYNYINVVKNLLYNTYNNFSRVGVTGSLTKLSETYQGCDVYRLTMTIGSSASDSVVSSFRTQLWNHGICGFNHTFYANTKYAFWIYYRPVTHTDIRVGGTASNIGNWTEIVPAYYQDGWYRVGQYRNGSVTSDKTDNIYTSFYTPTASRNVPISIDFCCPHLVVGETSIIEETEFNPGIEFDCSGNGYNGEHIGTLTADTDSARYDIATVYASSSSAIRIPVIFSMNQTVPELTLSIWFKTNTLTGTLPNLICMGNNAFVRYRIISSSSIWYFIRINGSIYRASYTTKDANGNTIILTDNKWHHAVFTYTSAGVASIYVDGVLCGSATHVANTPLQCAGSNVDHWCIGGYSLTAEKFIGSLSDCRVYTTAFSADEVKALYGTAASIAKDGSAYAVEFKEV